MLKRVTHKSKNQPLWTMTQEAVLYIRQSWVQIMSVYAEKLPLFQLPSLCRTLGSQPGLVTYGRGDAVPCCPSYMAWPSLLGLFQLRHPFVFTLQCEPDVGGTSLCGRPLPNPQHRPQAHGRLPWPTGLSWPSARLSLKSGPPWHPCISPSPNVTGSWKGHWTNIQSPYVLDGLPRNFGDASLLRVSWPFHS